MINPGSFILMLFLIFYISNFVVALVIYIDAKKYTNSPALWFFVVLLLPIFLGLILYFIIRSDSLKNKINCPSCNQEVEKSYIYCPMCHYKLKKTCHNCNAYLEEFHRACPYCGTSAVKECKSCGKDLELDYHVCPYCGEKVEEDCNGKIK